MKSLARVLGSTGLALGLLGAAQAAPVTWAGNGHQYDVIRAEAITWSAANAAASALGSGWHLATITSAGEDAFVASQLTTAWAERSHFWLGATDAAVEGTWAWGTGEAFSYANWAGGEPNNAGNEDYLAYDLRSSTWAWNDAPNDLLASGYPFGRGYVIERSNVPEPGSLSLLGLAFLAAGLVRRRRAAV